MYAREATAATLLLTDRRIFPSPSSRCALIPPLRPKRRDRK